jgi:hypothetical protein
MLSRYERHMLDKWADYSPIHRESFTMMKHDTLVKADSSKGPFTITLPPAAECEGMMYVVKMMTTDEYNEVTISAGKGAENWGSDLVLINYGDAVILVSDGEQWHLLSREE